MNFKALMKKVNVEIPPLGEKNFNSTDILALRELRVWSVFDIRHMVLLNLEDNFDSFRFNS